MGAIKVSDLATALGSYYRENRGSLLPNATNDFVTSKHVQHMAGVVNQVPLVTSDTTGVVQPYQSGWTPIGDDVAFNAANILEVKRAKLDLEFDPIDKLYANWLGYLSQNKMKASDYVFEEFILQHITKQWAHDHENIAWKGSYAAPTPGTPGAVTTTATGYKKLIADAITATTLTATTTGALSSTNAVEKVELVYNALPDAVKNKGGKIFMSQTILNYYRQDFRTKYTSAPYNTDMLKTYLDLDPRWELVAVPGLAGSGRVVATPMDNFVMGYNIPLDAQEMEFQPNRRVIDVLATYTIGFQVGRWDHVAVNDQA